MKDITKAKEWYLDAVLGGLVLSGMMKDDAIAKLDNYNLESWRWAINKPTSMRS